MVLPELPVLTDQPEHHQNYCASLSNRLLDTLSAILPHSPEGVFSIGSGTGLLEALLTQHDNTIDVLGVEVTEDVNVYLPKEKLRTVAGTWDTILDAILADAWLFVYPREPTLMEKYLDQCGGGTVQVIVWLGPGNDWDDYRPLLQRFASKGKLEIIDDCGLAPYELLAVAKRSIGQS
ncbi:hypothetical protein L228DRAFT_283328 [Xylona heveae TC161]|uniref:S-adenosyl-L-methionine-dependent methyltransferase n=1 Tax=Xylona heveae (strain CBS 132557 / TC161) TaxID=1328760 RepID=A0A165GGB3_XYLHT|nr:hypothetical protein L228DRAFT_283328 [Xylona heveae TC161]KZF22149.1 hypothetical protein L228DRAFT_283328 [Xylona heveae TC161]